MQTNQEDIKELTGRGNAIKKKIKPVDCNQAVTGTKSNSSLRFMN